MKDFPERRVERGDFALLRRGRRVGDAREDHALGVGIERGRFEGAEDDALLVEQDEIGVFAHDLGIEIAFGGGEIAPRKEAEAEDPFEPDELHARDLRALQVLPEQHTEIGRDEGDGRLRPLEIGAAIGGVCVEREFDGAPSGVYKKRDFVLGGLYDLVDVPPAELFVQFFCDQSQGKGVLRHIRTS